MWLKHWCYKWSQIVISVSLCIQRSVKKMQGSLVSVWNYCPDHNTTSAPTIDFLYAASNISFTSSPPHTYTTISMRQVKARFVWKQNFLPSLTSPGKCPIAHSNRWRRWRLGKYWTFEFVARNRCLRHTIVLRLQLKLLATFLVDIPARNIPNAWLRSSALRRAMEIYLWELSEHRSFLLCLVSIAW
jgi:hypothetical protein